VQHCHPEVHHNLQLAFGVAHTGGNSHGSHPLDAVVHAEAAGEKAVVDCILKDVLLLHSDHDEVPGHEVGPGLDILGRISHHCGLAGGTGRGMHPHHLLPGHGEEAEGIIVSQILLSCSGQAGDVRQALDVFWSYSRLLEFPVIKGDAIANFLCHALEPAKLQLLKLSPLHEFILWLPVVHFHTLIEFDFSVLCSAMRENIRVYQIFRRSEKS